MELKRGKIFQESICPLYQKADYLSCCKSVKWTLISDQCNMLDYTFKNYTVL